MFDFILARSATMYALSDQKAWSNHNDFSAQACCVAIQLRHPWSKWRYVHTWPAGKRRESNVFDCISLAAKHRTDKDEASTGHSITRPEISRGFCGRWSW